MSVYLCKKQRNPPEDPYILLIYVITNSVRESNLFAVAALASRSIQWMWFEAGDIMPVYSIQRRHSEVTTKFAAAFLLFNRPFGYDFVMQQDT